LFHRRILSLVSLSARWHRLKQYMMFGDQRPVEPSSQLGRSVAANSNAIIIKIDVVKAAMFMDELLQCFSEGFASLWRESY